MTLRKGVKLYPAHSGISLFLPKQNDLLVRIIMLAFLWGVYLIVVYNKPEHAIVVYGSGSVITSMFIGTGKWKLIFPGLYFVFYFHSTFSTCFTSNQLALIKITKKDATAKYARGQCGLCDLSTMAPSAMRFST